MRLASKIFLGFSLVIVVLAAVGVLGLRAVGRLVSVNREIASEALPALRLTSGVRDTLQTMARLEARFVVLRDRRYADLWRESAAHARADLARLADLVHSGPEASHLAGARVAFDRYHAAVLQGQSRLLARATPPTPGDESPTRPLGEQVETELEALQQATHARVHRAQAEVARLERRTWNGVIVALATALVLALLATAVIALRMARSFNAMVDRLHKHDELKEEFFATLSHELRSPITSVREAAHLLADGVPGPLTAKQGRLVEIIRRSTERLLRLVNQILDVSRLRAGLLPLEFVPLDLDWLVARAIDELRPQADEARVALVRERVGTRFTVHGDEDRLVQVVVNLLANAVRFTPVGGRVTVRLVDAGPECEIQVEDNGVGIPAAELPHIFESYRQAHPGKGGTGLGLAIVRGLVQAHGGRVTAESQEGKGSRFSVLLPRDRAA